MQFIKPHTIKLCPSVLGIGENGFLDQEGQCSAHRIYLHYFRYFAKATMITICSFTRILVLRHYYFKTVRKSHRLLQIRMA